MKTRSREDWISAKRIDTNQLYINGGQVVPTLWGRELFVDKTNGVDTNDGLTPEYALKTMTGLKAKLLSYGSTANGWTVYVFSGYFEESVVIPDYEDYPSYIKIIGVGNDYYSPSWYSGSATEPCFVMGAVGWTISGFRFYVPATDAGIIVPCTIGTGWADAIGIRTKIENCYFDGSVYTGKYGIDLHGAPYNVSIRNNKFGFLTASGACGIVSTETSYADAYRTEIVGNWFHESTGGIDASLNVSLITDNVIQAGGANTMTTCLDLRGGTIGKNIVTNNHFNGDYSNTGGYYAGTSDDWIGNFASDVAEITEVDATTGITFAIPAA
jgi:hypothetical protein